MPSPGEPATVLGRSATSSPTSPSAPATTSAGLALRGARRVARSAAGAGGDRRSRRRPPARRRPATPTSPTTTTFNDRTRGPLRAGLVGGRVHRRDSYGDAAVAAPRRDGHGGEGPGCRPGPCARPVSARQPRARRVRRDRIDPRLTYASGWPDARREPGETVALTAVRLSAGRGFDVGPVREDTCGAMNVLRTKSIEQSLEDTEDVEFKLKKGLTALDLTVFGIGVVIGAGIFTLTGKVGEPVRRAGRGVLVPARGDLLRPGGALLRRVRLDGAGRGSAYTFSYATLGEMVAWIIGWDLILELMLGASVVAQGWSTYLVTFLDEIGITWPRRSGPRTPRLPLGPLQPGRRAPGGVLTTLIAIGIKESLRVNLVLVGDQALHRAVRDHRRPVLRLGRQLPPVHPAGRRPDRRQRPDPAAAAVDLRDRAADLRRPRHHLRGVGGLLRLHRLRRRRHHRRGGQQPAEGPAQGHPRLARDLHGALHGGRAGDHRHGARTTRSTPTPRSPPRSPRSARTASRR